MLGLKGDSSMFGGIGRALGIGAAGLGIIGSARAGYLASKKADETNEAKTTGFAGMWNRGKHLVAGIAGGVAGGYTGLNAAMTAKDHALKSTLDAMGKRNANDIARGANGSTFRGRAWSSMQRLASGQDSYERESSQLGIAKARENAAKDLVSYLEGKGKSKNSSAIVAPQVEPNFKVIGESVDSYNQKVARAKASVSRGGSGDFTVSYLDSSGARHTRTINVNQEIASDIGKKITYEAGREWALSSGASDAGYTQKLEDYNYVAEAEFNPNSDDAVDKLNTVAKVQGGLATHIERSRGYNRHKADHGASGGSSK